MKNLTPNNYQKLVSEALKGLSNQRTSDIISLRFGLKDGKRKTLEEIGRKYNITRERVRQIEEVAFSDLKKSNSVNTLKAVFDSIDIFLNQEGGIAREERLLTSLTGYDRPHPSRGSIFFSLTLGKPYHRFVESNKFHPLWANSKDAVSRAEKIIDFLVKRIEQERKTLPLDHVFNYSKELDRGINREALSSYLDLTKEIDQNNFGHFGLAKWPEINPRGAKDKAYIVLKEQGQPLHFRNVADLINQANLGPNLAQPQTVHNELIKDERFILVGRGTYALKEWGYQPGTIKDVIIQTLEENGPMEKEDILEKVLENRLAKKNTVLINLQNKEYFAKNQDGKYTLIKK
ncbi:MAG: sigma factor-like helix-turn-helix DNA-binding protein [Candidatus Portnoybacteria bacterium]